MRYKIADQLSIRRIENDIFILNRNDSHLHTFNESGAELWSAIESNDSSEALLETLIRTYDVDRVVAEKDVDDFLAELMAMHLITPL